MLQSTHLKFQQSHLRRVATARQEIGGNIGAHLDGTIQGRPAAGEYRARRQRSGCADGEEW